MEPEKKAMASELMLQIIARRKNFINYLRQQTEDFNRHLFSKCILEGMPPPPWLCPPRPHASHVVHESAVAKDRLSVSPSNPVSDLSLDSPEDREEVIIPKSCVRRSKSRQKAFELRNSSKVKGNCSKDSQEVATTEQVLEDRSTVQLVQPCELKFNDLVAGSDDACPDEKEHCRESTGMEHEQLVVDSNSKGVSASDEKEHVCSTNGMNCEETLLYYSSTRKAPSSLERQQSASSSFNEVSFQHDCKFMEREKDVTSSLTRAEYPHGILNKPMVESMSIDLRGNEAGQSLDIMIGGDQYVSPFTHDQESENLEICSRNPLPGNGFVLEERLQIPGFVRDEKEASNHDELTMLAGQSHEIMVGGDQYVSSCTQDQEAENLETCSRSLLPGDGFVLEEKLQNPGFFRDEKEASNHDEQIMQAGQSHEIMVGGDQYVSSFTHDREAENLEICSRNPLTGDSFVLEEELQISCFVRDEKEASNHDELEERSQGLDTYRDESAVVYTSDGQTLNRNESDLIDNKIKFNSVDSPVGKMASDQNMSEFESCGMNMNEEHNIKSDLLNAIYQSSSVDRLRESESRNTSLSGQIREIKLQGDENPSLHFYGQEAKNLDIRSLQADNLEICSRNLLHGDGCGFEETLQILGGVHDETETGNHDELEERSKDLSIPYDTSAVTLNKSDPDLIYSKDNFKFDSPLEVMACKQNMSELEGCAMEMDESDLPNFIYQASAVERRGESASKNTSLSGQIYEMKFQGNDNPSFLSRGQEANNLDICLTNQSNEAGWGLEERCVFDCSDVLGDKIEHGVQDLSRPYHEYMEVCTIDDQIANASQPDLIGYKFGFDAHDSSAEELACDPSVSEFEGFVMKIDDEPENKLAVPNALYRASMLEEFCKSASTDTPISEFSKSYEFRKQLNLHFSAVTQCKDDTLSIKREDSLDSGKKFRTDNNLVAEKMTSDFSEQPLAKHQPCDIIVPKVKKPYSSPVRKIWDGVLSKSGSSGKHTSSTSELPRIIEEIEDSDEITDASEDGRVSGKAENSVKRFLFDSTSNSSLTESDNKEDNGCSRSSFTTLEVDGCASSNIIMGTNDDENEKKISVTSSNVHKVKSSVRQTMSKYKLSQKSDLNKEYSRFSNLEKPKRNNIVSGITSFIPLVREKQAKAIVPGKREVKIKALEVAETAKRLAEKREHERKMKKDALKLAREEKEAQKKQEVELIARKRQREEEERKEAQKRKRVGKITKKTEAMGSTKKIEHGISRNNEKIASINNHLDMLSECQSKTIAFQTVENNSMQCDQQEKAKINAQSATVAPSHVIVNTSQEASYIMSPYKDSDDECEDDIGIGIPTSKFIPYWASSEAVHTAVLSHKKIPTESVIPPRISRSLFEGCRPKSLT